MPAEMDFSKGVRGKFYSPNARFHLPVYLDEAVLAVLAVLTAAAQRKGVEVSELANEMLKRDIENAQALR
ncbi:MAG: hypothetical protein RJA63_308 [Pseudomonadota bacterium]|jgi:hypothetical protein|nr:hypothetical protein [Uliginosibacterium sp.]